MRRTRLLLLPVLVLPSAACAGSPAAEPTTSRSSAAPTTSSAPAPTTANDAVPGPAGPAPEVARGLQPVRIAIAAIGVDAAVTDLGLESDGSIEVPGDPARAGWVDRTPAPGQQGPSVVAGHVDSTTGPAVFYRLGRLEAGDQVVVTRRDGSSVTFAVDDVRTYAKKKFPTRATYGPVPVPALRLITCGGAYDKSAGGYQDNVVAFASEV